MELSQSLWTICNPRATNNKLYVATCSPARDTGSGYVAWGHSALVGPALEVLKEDDEIREEHHINLESDGEVGGHKEESKKGEESQRNAILVVAALVIRLTYQSMVSPPSSFVVTPSYDIWKDTTVAVLAFMFMIFNSCVFLQSIYVVVATLHGPTVFPVRVLALFLMLCYSILLANFFHTGQYARLDYVVLGIALLISCILEHQNFFIRCMPRCRRQQPEASSAHSQ